MKDSIIPKEETSRLKGGLDEDYNLGHNLGRHVRQGVRTVKEIIDTVVGWINPFD